jgi:hypothetical protein
VQDTFKLFLYLKISKIEDMEGDKKEGNEHDHHEDLIEALYDDGKQNPTRVQS